MSFLLDFWIYILIEFDNLLLICISGMLVFLCVKCLR